MTRPRVSRLWLMFPASLALLSTAPDLPMFSLPAKSTYSKEIRDMLSITVSVTSQFQLMAGMTLSIKQSHC